EDAPPLGGALFEELSLMGRNVIFESTGWKDPVKSLLATAKWVKRARMVASDLEWKKLTPWRRLMSQTLDPDTLKTLDTIVLEHSPQSASQAYLLAGWL